MRFLVDRDAVGHQTLLGFQHSLSVFQAMSAFVDVQIIGFAVGQQQQQTLSFWSAFQALMA